MLPSAALPNLLSGLRLLLIPILSWAALNGQGRLVGIGLVAAGATDFLDGYLARRLGVAGPTGARLDALADNLLLVAAALWMLQLHPEIASENPGLLLATATVYITALVASVVRFGRTNLRLYSSKIAGGCLYAFAVVTLISGDYEPAVLAVAAIALLVSSAEMLLAAVVLRSRKDMTMTESIAAARKLRSQSPQAEKPDGASATAITSRTIIVMPSARETRT